MRPALVQTAWAGVIVRALGDAGVVAVVLSPGSRSTPLAAALAGQDAIAVHVIVDERAAGFFALGLARAGGAPVALVCTSGTAPAHYYPAVIEAALAEVPLVVVSADRPPELHGSGAPQTIDQNRLFGGHVRAFVDLGAPEGSELALRALRRRVVQAVLASRSPRPGPVHLDVPLRKPLEPTAPVTASEAELLVRADAIAARATVPPPPRAPRAAHDAIAALAAALAAARRPMIVIGPRTTDRVGDAALAAAVSRLARSAGAVVVAETASGLRGALEAGTARLDAFDVVMGTPALAALLAPDLILQLGAEPVAMAWPALLASQPARWVIAAQAWPDADSSATGLVLGDVVDTLERTCAATPRRPGDAAWLRAVALADDTAWATVDELLRAPAAEGAAVRAALDGAGDAVVVLGNSLPVRVVDQVWRGDRPRRVISQRGASGIDGLIAGAAGTAAAGQPVVLIVGDVSFAHDAGALPLLRRTGAPVVIVVIDNGGGRIFEALPVAGTLSDDAFARLWLTPPGLDVVAVTRAFGVTARAVVSADELRAAVAAAHRLGTAVLHAPVAPSSARALRRDAIARLADAAGAIRDALHAAPDAAPPPPSLPHLRGATT